MNCARRYPLLPLALALLAGAKASPSFADPAAPTPEQVEFFEKSVRPVLANRCWKCHGPEKQESGLRLDAGEPALKGGESGPVIVAGEPDKSPLIAAIRYQGDTQMPPAAKLPENELAALVAWVQIGAPWPKDAAKSDESGSRPSAHGPPSAQEAQATHWAFQPVVRPEVPAVTRADWCATPVDSFVLKQLESGGLSPSSAADRRTLLRRASFDLLGLPPTPDDVEAFERDASPDAWQKVVDRLLASPHYGERWARHWLDVARYADTKGYVFTQERRYPFSYTYRDYVVRAMNDDLPYDQFVSQQLAADCLPLGDDKRPLAALGFLTVGRRFMFNVHDIIDDRIDVVSRGLLGLTVTCARCHDHKFDPVPSADYYSLYGVFASSTEPEEEPLICKPEETAGYEQFLQKKAALQKEVDDYRAAKQRELEERFRSQAGDYLAHLVRGRPGEPAQEEPMVSLGPGELRPQMVERWRRFVERPEASKDPVFAPWHELAAIPAAEFSGRAGGVIDRLAAETGQPINGLIKQALIERRPASMLEVARLYGDLLAAVDKQWTEACTATPPPERLSDPAGEELRQVLYGSESPVKLSDERAQRLFDREARDHLTALKRKVDEWEATSPAAPPRAMALLDAPSPVEPHIFLRGNPGRPGEKVPRQFLAVLSQGERRPFEHGSGRVDLAQAIVSRDNPLTARVLVNRVWLHHFGSPLVRTPSDFGVRSEPPSHPALLDWLAATFMDEGWSLKRLHRMILLSNTYQQASADRPDCAAVDPENRLLWRMNRRRLDFESMRDGYLAVSGGLDGAMGGRPIDIWAQPFSPRRSVYAYLDRQDLPGVFRIFDFANPDVSNDQRPRTTVPQQALFAMNSPFALDQVRRLAARPEVAGEADPARRVAALYRLALARPATAEEVDLALKFVAAVPGESKLSPWQLLAQVLLSTNEFMFVD
ncbi:MAG TPA: PSD1 and planctomycete cytochrome C domain-containing protein [Pirellulales bacterium]|nr:PSD1 and planctomycete cytochrome C domain-containing protein [Pirellulales bacterium]